MHDSNPTCVLSKNIYEKYLTGYLLKSLPILSKSDIAMIPDFLSLITYELGVRFFNDFVEGDRYFSVNYPLNNLYRSIVQFRLLNDIQRKNHLLLSIIEKLNK